ncbi:unnamed protein product [Didymodactylos carnosus]|uniref:Uncharacterized protein n=1 Tax=Didymodactylos carnosus TaxID=1234261 RepID=A0A814EBD7_9BILA|nr:unnamed protein product [Didymodactylos carnosus]CAF3737879.1 unnamed protein product [Didymodactylos carnosus]
MTLSKQLSAYRQAFKDGSFVACPTVDLTGLYGRITKGNVFEHFQQLSDDTSKRLSWVFDSDTLRTLVGMPSMDILHYIGNTDEWIQQQLRKGKKFKLIVFGGEDVVKLATWDNIVELMKHAYPEINDCLWEKYRDELSQLSFEQINSMMVKEQDIVQSYYKGRDYKHYITVERFNAIQNPTLGHLRALLYHHIGLNELFTGTGYTMRHEGTITGKEYLVTNKPLKELDEYLLLDIDLTSSEHDDKRDLLK